MGYLIRNFQFDLSHNKSSLCALFFHYIRKLLKWIHIAAPRPVDHFFPHRGETAARPPTKAPRKIESFRRFMHRKFERKILLFGSILFYFRFNSMFGLFKCVLGFSFSFIFHFSHIPFMYFSLKPFSIVCIFHYIMHFLLYACFLHYFHVSPSTKLIMSHNN